MLILILITFFSVGCLTEACCIPEVWLGGFPPSAFTELSLSHPTPPNTLPPTDAFFSPCCALDTFPNKGKRLV